MVTFRNSNTVTLDENGVLSLSGVGDYHFEYKARSVELRLDHGPTTRFSLAEYASITALNIGAQADLTMSAREIAGLEIANLAGSLNITRLRFTEAGPAGGFETSVNLDSVVGSAIDIHGAGYVATHLVANGSKADGFKLLWDYLDDAYVAGNNYYDIPLNENFIRFGVEYAKYLDAGGKPLTDITAKYTVDGADAGTIPDREQLMHDNLLGNLWGPAVQGRGFPAALEAELLALIPDAYEARPTFSGDEAALGGGAHDAVRAFDYDRGWKRPDYLETDIDGTVDPRAQDTAESDMLYGDGNTINGWNIVRHEGAGVELALKAKVRGGVDYVGVLEPDGIVHYDVDAGTDPNNAARAAWNFDFAATSGISGQDETVDQFDFRLLVDVNRTAATRYLTIDPALIPDNPVSDYSEQNSENYSFGFIYSLIDGDPRTRGIQPYDFGAGRFDIKLLAYDDGKLIATNHIAVDVMEAVI